MRPFPLCSVLALWLSALPAHGVDGHSPPPAATPSSQVPAQAYIDRIGQWSALPLPQRLALEDYAVALHRALVLIDRVPLPPAEHEAAYHALQHSRYCARLHLYGVPNAPQWLYRVDALVMPSPEQHEALRRFNRASLGFDRPLPQPEGCI